MGPISAILMCNPELIGQLSNCLHKDLIVLYFV